MMGYYKWHTAQFQIIHQSSPLNHSSLISWLQDDSFHAQFKWKWKVFARINLGACQIDKGMFIRKCHCYLEQHKRVYKLLIYLKSNNT